MLYQDERHPAAWWRDGQGDTHLGLGGSHPRRALCQVSFPGEWRDLGNSLVMSNMCLCEMKYKRIVTGTRFWWSQPYPRRDSQCRASHISHTSFTGFSPQIINRHVLPYEFLLTYFYNWHSFGGWILMLKIRIWILHWFNNSKISLWLSPLAYSSG